MYAMTTPFISLGRGGTYLLTWTTYGTWLPGDDRGFVSLVPDGKAGSIIHNVPGEAFDRNFRSSVRRRQEKQKVRQSG